MENPSHDRERLESLEIDCRTVARRLSETAPLVLIDCREPHEYEIARIDGARLVPLGQLSSSLPELVSYRHSEVVVYCHHGGRSLAAAAWLREQGFPGAKSMAGGIDRWSVEIDPSVPRYS